ncbi:unnamed protein product [Parascedosporium putredinis]|uniref:Amino acid permease/ SLC12A domain-containing protein n=1 Tax=Parascedosporium putredinis TaxID=1442378 RepID=A0A9P1MFV4_9PEZI|nr:unnamed protein product [Parascedosporium putredinis]CAI8004234.1 unnamed protein product [Parascedosporium putredinis]
MGRTGSDAEKTPSGAGTPKPPSASGSSITSKPRFDYTHRTLKARHIQLIGIGGTIGTALFVQIGQAFWCTFVLAVTLCMAEMVTYLPISSPFIRFAGRFVDEAFGFAAGWNFFVFEAMLVPFEIVACNMILHFWTDAIPTAAVIVIISVLYLLINVIAVEWYGETEFWAAIGKVILAVGLIFFTFIVMLGGNPKHDRFGFRYWKDPGAFAELYYNGSLGGKPAPRAPRAFNAVFYRLTTFFVLGALCVGILVPYNSEELTAALREGEPGAAASPYVIAMRRLGIGVMPDVVNALVLTAAFSAGNSYVFCGSRSLYGLALEGKAPRFLLRCTPNGVPIYCVLAVLAFGMLAFLQLSSSSAVVLSWLVSLVTASQLLNFAVSCLSYLCFYRALKAQGIDRRSLPYRAWFMPYAAWYGFVGTFVMIYTMIMLFPVLYLGWKIVHKTKIYKPYEVDLRKDLDAIEEYERTYIPQPPKYALLPHPTSIYNLTLLALSGIATAQNHFVFPPEGARWHQVPSPAPTSFSWTVTPLTDANDEYRLSPVHFLIRLEDAVGFNSQYVVLEAAEQASTTAASRMPGSTPTSSAGAETSTSGSASNPGFGSNNGPDGDRRYDPSSSSNTLGLKLGLGLGISLAFVIGAVIGFFVRRRYLAKASRGTSEPKLDGSVQVMAGVKQAVPVPPPPPGRHEAGGAPIHELY